MSSVKLMGYGASSGHTAGMTNIQAKDWLSAETAARPFASKSMGSQEGIFGCIEGRPNAMKARASWIGDI
eukprot:8537352-Pyramimonas_sp.AAC.1